jgi:hypothetical protein
MRLRSSSRGCCAQSRRRNVDAVGNHEFLPTYSDAFNVVDGHRILDMRQYGHYLQKIGCQTRWKCSAQSRLFLVAESHLFRDSVLFSEHTFGPIHFTRFGGTTPPNLDKRYIRIRNIAPT